MSRFIRTVSCAAALNRRSGLRSARMDLEGVQTVLQLRSKYGEPKKALADPAKYYDPSFYDAAMER